MKFLSYIVVFIGGLVVCYLFLSLGVVERFGGIPSYQKDPVQGISIYLSFVGVLLTAVTAVLAALAIGIGVVAAYTFRDLKTEARTISEKTSKEVTSDALSEVRIKAMVLELYAKADMERQQTKEWGDDPTDNEDR